MSHVKNRDLMHFVWTTYERMPWIKPDIASTVSLHLTVAQSDGCEASPKWLTLVASSAR